VPDCPQKINIPDIFDTLNKELIFNDVPGAKFGYGWATNSGGKASDCVECGQCEDVCPQKIKIIDNLKVAVKKFE
jgi:predicted aldo/keto reductase-like oxidoreductase